MCWLTDFMWHILLITSSSWWVWTSAAALWDEQGTKPSLNFRRPAGIRLWRGASGCLCVRVESVCEASSCLMSWEAGHRRKTTMVSCWGVVSTLWWPCFRTHTHTQGSWLRVREGCRRRRMAWEQKTTSGEEGPLTFFFQWRIYIARVDTVDHRRRWWWWDHAILATGGQVNVAAVRRGATD